MSTRKTEILDEVERELAALARWQAEHRLDHYRPYAPQRAFHDAGKHYREIMLAAGNQQGKTLSGAAEMAYHLTGLYPTWWDGKKFKHAIRAWAGGVTGINTRDNVQRMLCGPTTAIGTGFIPKDLIMLTRPARGLADAIDTVFVKHVTGDYSSLVFKSYEQGRAKWQSETVHVLWMDEEPPEEIYTEALARITATKGMVYTTFTPLMGMTEIARRFFLEESPNRALVQMTIEDAEHIAQEERQKIIDGYPEHEREARTKGIPALGSGRVYPVAESVLTIDPIPLPDHWPRICGIDFGGWDHPTAVVWMAHDRDTDTVYVYDCYRASKVPAAVHASAIRGRGDWIPCAWPHDGLEHEKGSGDIISDIYRNEGVNMLFQRAQFADKSMNVEPGILRLLNRMVSYRFKVFNHLADWLSEFRMYHRKEGIIVKSRDDLMDATRYAEMMISYATTPQRIVPINRDSRPKSWRVS